jgi:hypothetical protein
MHSRRRFGPGLAMVLPVALAAGGVAWACTDSSCYPNWRLGAVSYDCAGQALIDPGNDTRINMLWLMRSLGKGLPPVQPAPAPGATEERQFGRTYLSWSGLRAALWPAPTAAPDSAGPANACAAAITGGPGFKDALAHDPAVPPAERAALGALRDQVGCGAVTLDNAPVTSPAGHDYLAYLRAAQAFYTGDWAGARQGFAALAHAKSGWIVETAAYMPIRIALRAAVAGAVDQYGDFAGQGKVDAAAVASARAGIAAYLKAYPEGLYAESARGLERRVTWLSGDMPGLARSYETLLATTPGDSEAAADLAEEIDSKLLEREDAGALIDGLDHAPLLLATIDLKRMRRDQDGPDEGHLGPAQLSAAQLAGQQARFAAQPDLYGLLAASRVLYADEDPRQVLALLPDAARAPGYTPLAFSRQMLRGMALARARDPHEAGFWQDLLKGASPLYQRPLVEMGLVARWQRDGRVAEVFAPGSPITDSMTREILLQTLASPAILRGEAGNAARPAHERDVARFTLLYKDLSHGAFADFSGDLALLPAGANTQANLWDFSMQEDIPTGLFRAGRWADGAYPCPPLNQTAATLARAPRDARARLCLGEFYRLNGFDGFSLFRPDPHQPDRLGNGTSGFPGRPLSRGDLYAAIIDDPAAGPDERAYALYRAVMCYAPSGSNGCAPPATTLRDLDAAQVPKEQRKAWFNQLKQRYPASRWAQALRYYW